MTYYKLNNKAGFIKSMHDLIRDITVEQNEYIGCITDVINFAYNQEQLEIENNQLRDELNYYKKRFNALGEVIMKSEHKKDILTEYSKLGYKDYDTDGLKQYPGVSLIDDDDIPF